MDMDLRYGHGHAVDMNMYCSMDINMYICTVAWTWACIMDMDMGGIMDMDMNMQAQTVKVLKTLQFVANF
jgi:hypothetical protein